MKYTVEKNTKTIYLHQQFTYSAEQLQELIKEYPEYKFMVEQPINLITYPTPYYTDHTTRLYNETCQCNPANGESGVCGCILAGPTITS